MTVGRWLAANDSRAELLDPASRRAALERFVATTERARFARMLDDVARRLQNDLAGPPATVRGTPLGYRVLRSSSAESIVETWELVISGALNVEPGVVLARSRITLVWEDGWRVASTAIRGRAVSAVTASDLAAADQQFTSFRHVP